MDKLAQRGIRLAVALDGMGEAVMFSLAQELGDVIDIVKVHMAVDRYGIRVVHKLAKLKPVFGDPKIHDTPRTTMLRVNEYRLAGATFVTVHAKEEVLKAAASVAGKDITVVAVTTLTSVRQDPNSGVRVLQKTQRAAMHGLTNITCPAHESQSIRNSVNYHTFHCFIPAIQPDWAPMLGGQERAADHRQAIKWAHERDCTLILGRCVTEANSYGSTPLEAARRIRAEINDLL